MVAKTEEIMENSSTPGHSSNKNVGKQVIKEESPKPIPRPRKALGDSMTCI